MKKLLVYLKDYKKESILGPLFKLLEASFELLVPLVVTKIIDVGIATGDVHYIVRMVLLMVGLISTITYFYQSIAMKVIASENPLPLNDELTNALHISSDELKNIKRTNFFFAQ